MYSLITANYTRAPPRGLAVSLRSHVSVAADRYGVEGDDEGNGMA